MALMVLMAPNALKALMASRAGMHAGPWYHTSLRGSIISNICDLVPVWR